jgi:hypothetical protein
VHRLLESTGPALTRGLFHEVGLAQGLGASEALPRDRGLEGHGQPHGQERPYTLPGPLLTHSGHTQRMVQGAGLSIWVRARFIWVRARVTLL